MRRAGWLVMALWLGACLEPGDLSNSSEIYEAINARDSGTDAGSGGGGTGGGGAGGMGGMGGSTADASMGGECGDVLEDLIKPRCAQSVCHSTAAMGVLDFESDDLASRLIGQDASSACEDHKYIDADNPEDSLIYTKLSADPPCGARMPFSGEPLTEDEQACMLEFIEQLIADQ